MYSTPPVGGQDGSGGSFWTSSALGRSLSRLDYNGGRGEGRAGESPLVMRRRTEELCARWDGLALDIDEILEAPIDSSLHLMPTGGRMSQPYVQSSAQHGVLPLGESAEPLHLFHTIRNRKHVLHCYELLLMRTLEEDPDLWQRLCDTFTADPATLMTWSRDAHWTPCVKDDCDHGYSKVAYDLNGGGKMVYHAGHNTQDCAKKCNERSGCTAYEFNKGGNDDYKCITYTAEPSSLHGDEHQQFTGWASCIKDRVAQGQNYA